MRRPIDFHNRDFAINPKTLDMSTLTGGGQHGMTFNRWGNRFVCSNSDHLQAIVFEERYLSRNPYQSVVSARRSIASDGPQAEVYRISPIEGWRIARTQMRVSGVAPGPIEGGGRAGGYFTGATGVTVYEGGQWPNERRHDRAHVRCGQQSDPSQATGARMASRIAATGSIRTPSLFGPRTFGSARCRWRSVPTEVCSSATCIAKRSNIRRVCRRC